MAANKVNLSYNSSSLFQSAFRETIKVPFTNAVSLGTSIYENEDLQNQVRGAPLDYAIFVELQEKFQNSDTEAKLEIGDYKKHFAQLGMTSEKLQERTLEVIIQGSSRSVVYQSVNIFNKMGSELTSSSIFSVADVNNGRKITVTASP